MSTQDTTVVARGLPLNGEALNELVPLMYEQLRKVAAHRISGEVGHTLEAAELVHEAWLRIFGNSDLQWHDREHFFAVAAEAMRRILVDHTRKLQAQKRGSGITLEELSESSLVLRSPPDEILAADDALDFLEREDRQAAELVKLRYFVGLTMEETAAALGISKRAAENIWTYARTWLHREIRKRL